MQQCGESLFDLPDYKFSKKQVKRTLYLFSNKHLFNTLVACVCFIMG